MAVSAMLSAVGCAPAGKEAADPPASNVAAAEGRAKPSVEPVPDFDPATGVDRNVTYEPQLGPEPQERPRKDPPNSAPRR